MRRLLVSLAALLVAASANAAEPPRVDFSRDVQPILSEHCFACHGPDEAARKANLRLDLQAGAFGSGDSGEKAIIAGKAAESELVRRATSTDPAEMMPPPKAKRRLSAKEIELLTRWIDQGAAWGKHWAFKRPQRPAVPTVAHRVPVHNAIDNFIIGRLDQQGLTLSPPAAKETLLRRVTLDLTGLPPTLAEVDAFIADPSPEAYERVVDRLLASSRYGERWAWDWLDAARYADSNGYQGDPERTMWPWRDWVVNAINANMRYDQFTIEQLAGDLLPQATADQILASGFNRNNMHNGEGGRIAEETRVENVFDRVETTATIWLGVTFTCARCHDHKFDPFTLRDYYGLYDIYNQMSETGAGRGGQAPPVVDYATPADDQRIKETQSRHAQAAAAVAEFELTKFPRDKDKPLAESDVANSLPEKIRDALTKSAPSGRNVESLQAAIAYFEKEGDDKSYAALLKTLLDAVRRRDSARSAVAKVMVMDQLKQPRDSFILVKGAYDKATQEKIRGATPVSLTDGVSAAPQTSEARANRLDLARWLVSTENPLTARVTVNRFWQAFFGIGLVKTVEDFGVQGERPSHPELLDWLAVEFMESGWDVKRLHKLIVMSATYRQSSKVSPALIELDPENRLLSRGPRHRLPSWMLRDVALAASGLFVDKLGGPSVKPYQPEGIWEEATFGKKTYQQDHGEALYRRSLYVFWRRIIGPTMFFDNAARQTCTVKQFRTNTPLHALATLNDITYVEAARALAERVMVAASDTPSRIETAFRLVTSRKPTSAETEILQSRLNSLRSHFQNDRDAAAKLLQVGESKRNADLDAAEHAAFTSLCNLLLNLDEAISKE